MTLPRPVLIALVGVLLAGAAFFATRGTRESDSGTPAPTQAAQSKSSPQDAVKDAFASGKPVRSGRFEVSLVAREGRKQAAGFQATGRFQSQGKTATPKFDLDIEVDAQGQSLRAGAVSLGDRGFITKGNTAYPVPDQVWSELAGTRKRIASFAKGGKQSSSLLGMDPTKWLTALKSEGVERVGGTETDHVSGRIDVRRVTSDVVRLARSAGSGGSALPMPAGIESQVASAVKRADVDLYVGKQDRILRRASLVLAIELPPELRSSGFQKGELELDYQISDVNRPQEIAAPSDVSSDPITTAGQETLSVGTAALGVGVVAIDPPPGVQEAQAAGLGSQGSGSAPAKIDSRGLPKGVARALERRKVVVLFFRQRGGADDAATAASVATLKRGHRASIFSDSVRNVARYGPIVRGAGVSQGPSVVIVGPDRKAHLIEGYVDAETLAQEVADARR